MNKSEKPVKKAFHVAPSPLNEVKLELVIILLLGFVLWIVMDSITNSDLTQISVLFLFSAVGALWVVLRIRYLSKQANEK